MKVKSDFVTNSSSASIYLMVKTDLKTVEEFREKFNEYIEQYKNGEWGHSHSMHFWDGGHIKKTSTGWFQVEDWTSMFNYACDDIPHYMQALYLHWLIDPEDVMRGFGFEKIKIKVESDHIY